VLPLPSQPTLGRPAAMPIRLRKFIGAVALFMLVIVWALVAMALAQVPAIRDNTILSVAYYVVAGLGWVLPAMPVVSWMSRRDQ
jgi:drug/metabolite transporter (DMT)-like permease